MSWLGKGAAVDSASEVQHYTNFASTLITDAAQQQYSTIAVAAVLSALQLTLLTAAHSSACTVKVEPLRRPYASLLCCVAQRTPILGGQLHAPECAHSAATKRQSCLSTAASLRYNSSKYPRQRSTYDTSDAARGPCVTPARAADSLGWPGASDAAARDGLRTTDRPRPPPPATPRNGSSPQRSRGSRYDRPRPPACRARSRGGYPARAFILRVGSY